jgi:hypothetical protein
MPARHTFIDLAFYERLHALERRLWYSPIGLALFVIGIAGGAYAFWNMGSGPDFFSRPHDVCLGYGVFMGSYLALFCYYVVRFGRAKCPRCHERMQGYVADFGEGRWRSFICTIEINGRCYRQPYSEDDTRPWIRLMKMVRACPQCRTYVESGRIHEETCTEEELELIGQRVGNK